MSFWTDLQAWTQAQYDALMLANLKRKKKWTAEDINRLLRDRIAKRLKAKPGRAIGAEFLRTAGRISDPAVLAGLYLEHGFLNWSPTSLAHTYTPTWLHSYLTGVGTTLPDSIGNDHMIGRIGSGAVTCSGGSTVPRWPNNPPSLGLDGDYMSVAWPSIGGPGTLTAAQRPEYYTGLARLYAQSQIGGGREIGSRLPAGWASPGALWLARSPMAQGPVWWALKVSAAGVFGLQMTVPAIARCLVVWLADDDLATADDRRIAESWVLSLARPVADEDPVELVSASAMETLYDERLPMVWGWQTSAQVISGASADNCLAAAVLWDGGVGIGSDWRITSHVARLSLAWTDGEPSVTTSSETPVEWTMGRGVVRLFLPDDPGHWIRIMPPSPAGPSPDGTSGGPVAIWFEDGQEKLITHVFEPNTEWSDPLPDWASLDRQCGPGEQSGTYWGGTKGKNGWDGLPRMDPTSYVSRQGTQNFYRVVAGVPVEQLMGGAYCYQVPGAPETSDICTYLSGCPSTFVWAGPYTAENFPEDPLVRTPVGIGTGVKTIYEQSGNFSCGRVLLLGHTPGLVAYLHSDDWTASTYQATENYSTTDATVFGWPSTDGVVSDNWAGAGLSANYVQPASAWASNPITTYTPGTKSEFGAFVWAGGYSWSVPDVADWSWTSTDTPEGTCAAAVSYGMQTLLSLPDRSQLPDGIPALSGTGVWVGGD